MPLLPSAALFPLLALAELLVALGCDSGCCWLVVVPDVAGGKVNGIRGCPVTGEDQVGWTYAMESAR